MYTSKEHPCLLSKNSRFILVVQRFAPGCEASSLAFTMSYRQHNLPLVYQTIRHIFLHLLRLRMYDVITLERFSHRRIGVGVDLLLQIVERLVHNVLHWLIEHVRKGGDGGETCRKSQTGSANLDVLRSVTGKKRRRAEQKTYQGS